MAVMSPASAVVAVIVTATLTSAPSADRSPPRYAAAAASATAATPAATSFVVVAIPATSLTRASFSPSFLAILVLLFQLVSGVRARESRGDGHERVTVSDFVPGPYGACISLDVPATARKQVSLTAANRSAGNCGPEFLGSIMMPVFLGSPTRSSRASGAGAIVVV